MEKKEISYVEELAGKTNYSLSILKAARSLCEEAKTKGLGQEDVSALIKITAKKGA